MELQDNFHKKKNTIIAERSKRFKNYLIDQFSIFIYTTIFVLFIYDPGNLTLAYVIVSSFYYLIMEHFNGGKTMGKIVTKTKAVTIDSDKMSLNTILFRTLSRLIPFDSLSFLFYAKTGWHDMISKTIVVEEI